MMDINDVPQELDDAGMDTTGMDEKIEYIYRFCQTLEEVFNAVNQSPMAKMVPGMPDLSAFNKDE